MWMQQKIWRILFLLGIFIGVVSGLAWLGSVVPAHARPTVPTGEGLFCGLPLQNPTQGVSPTAQLGNFVWLDLNQNGIQDPAEPGVPGVIVILYCLAYHPQNAGTTGGNPVTLISTTTNLDGFYEFTVYYPFSDDIYLEFVPPPTLSFTLPDAITDTLDSDADPVTGQTEPFSLVEREIDNSWDAGLIPCQPFANLPHCPLLPTELEIGEELVANWQISQTGGVVIPLPDGTVGFDAGTNITPTIALDGATLEMVSYGQIADKQDQQLAGLHLTLHSDHFLLSGLFDLPSADPNRVVIVLDDGKDAGIFTHLSPAATVQISHLPPLSPPSWNRVHFLDPRVDGSPPDWWIESWRQLAALGWDAGTSLTFTIWDQGAMIGTATGDEIWLTMDAPTTLSLPQPMQAIVFQATGIPSFTITNETVDPPLFWKQYLPTIRK